MTMSVPMTMTMAMTLMTMTMTIAMEHADGYGQSVPHQCAEALSEASTSSISCRSTKSKRRAIGSAPW